jgi:acyl-CoA synthetase (AMP-forming)/AMP-acid ligase II
MIFRSHYPDITVPEMALTPFVLQEAGHLTGQPALIDGLSGRVITYPQLASRVRHAARSLVSRGYRKGDVFAIYSENLPEYAIAFHAIATVGGIVSPVNPRVAAVELAYQLNDAAAKCLITTSQLLDNAQTPKWNARLREVFTFDQADGATPFVELYESVLAPSEAPTNALIEPHNDLVALPYTGGRAGASRGVMRTHYGLVANLRQLNAAFETDGSDVAIAVVPFSQPYGMFMLMMHALWRGMTVVTLPQFELECFLQAVETYRVTKAYLTPSIVLALGRDPIVSDYDISSLNLITTGPTSWDDNIALECERRLNCPVRRGYGRGEQGPVTTINCGPDAANRRRSIGWLLPNVEAMVLDPETGRALGANQRGELWFRGPHVMAGYLNRPDETARAIDSEGWSRTGDIGYVDNDGYFYLEGRIKSLIGRNGSPAALAIQSAPPIRSEAATAGDPSADVNDPQKALAMRRP